MSNTTPSILLFSSLIVAAGACGGAPPGARPHDDSAAGHRAKSAEYAPEARLRIPGTRDYYSNLKYPRYTTAAAHLRAADQLEDERAEACEGKSQRQASEWPAVRSIDQVPDGVVLHVADDVGAPADVLADLRCHRATMAYGGFDAHPDDPLAMKELEIVVHPESQGTAVMLGVEGAEGVDELRRRAATLVTAEHE